MNARDRQMIPFSILLALLATPLIACGPKTQTRVGSRDNTASDGGSTPPDGGGTQPDGGGTQPDGGGTQPDGGATQPDGGLTDAGSAHTDDAGSPDAGGTPDAGPVVRCDSVPNRLITFQAPLGSPPIGAIAATAQNVFFAGYDSAKHVPSVAVIDANTHSQTAIVDLPVGFNVYGITASPEDAFIVGGPGSDLLYRMVLDGGASAVPVASTSLWCAYGEQAQRVDGSLYWVAHECEGGMSEATGAVMATNVQSGNTVQITTGFYTLGTDGTALLGNERSTPSEIDQLAGDGTVTPILQSLDGGQFTELTATADSIYALGSPADGPLYRMTRSDAGEEVVATGAASLVAAGGDLYYAVNTVDGGASSYTVKRAPLDTTDAGVEHAHGSGLATGGMTANLDCLYYVTRPDPAGSPSTYEVWTVGLAPTP